MSTIVLRNKKNCWRLALVLGAGVLLLGWTEAPGQLFGGPPPGEIDPLPPFATQRLGTVRFRQGSRILVVAYSPDRRILVSAGGDDPVHLWDAGTGQSLRTLPEKWVQAVAFTPDGRHVATGGGFKSIKVWETATGRNVATLKGHKSAVSALVFASDGNTLISASHDRLIKVWDLANTRETGQIAGHEDEVTCLALSPDGKMLASGSGDRSIRLWQLAGTQGLAQLNGGCAVAAVTFLADGKQLASAGDDGQIRIWDTTTKNELRRWKAHAGSVVSLIFNRDSKQLISGGLDRTIRVWDSDNGKQVLQIERGQGDSDALTVSSDGKTIAAGGSNCVVRRWELPKGNVLDGLTGPRGHITSLTFSNDGKQVVLASSDGALQVYDLLAGKLIRSWPTPHHSDLLLGLEPEGKQLVSLAGPEGIHLWDPGSGNLVGKIEFPGLTLPVCVALAPDGKSLAVGCRDNKILVYRAPLNGQAPPVQLNQNHVQALAFTGDGNTLLVASSDRVVLWNVAQNQQLRSIKTPPVACLAAAPNNRTFATGHHDSTIRIWDSNTGQELRLLEGHQSSVFSVHYSTSGQMLVSGSFDGTVKLWETASGQTITTWKGHRGAVQAVCLAPDGRLACSGSTDTTALLWDVTGRSKGGKLPAQDIRSMVEGMWNDLASDNAQVAHKALWTFVAGGEDAVEFLHKKVYLVDKIRVEKLIADLDSNKFSVRERATIELAGMGRWIEGRLEEASRNPASLEQKVRLGDLLRSLRKPGGITLQQERYRAKRVLEILEQVGSPRARELLRKLTRGAVETDLAEEAGLALERLLRRKG